MNDITGNKKKIETAYDSFAEKYDNVSGLKMISYATQLLQNLQISENSVVLDVGCGTGIATFELMKKVHGNGKFYGIDLSQEMIDLANAKALEFGQTNVEFSKGDAEQLSFPESSFDLIISNQVFHWIPKKEDSLKAMNRVLKPAGKIALGFQGGPSFKELFEAYDRIAQRRHEFTLFERPSSLTLEETQELFDKAGFQKSRIFAIHEVTYINPCLFWTNEDLTTSPWKIGLSLETARKVQKELAGELFKMKPENPLRTTIYSIFAYGQKRSK